MNAGTFNVGGNWGASTFNVGARLMGTGTTGALTALTGSQIAPGNSIGTMNVIGNATFNKGSTYEVELDHLGSSDLINATGAAQFDAGNAVEVAPQGTLAPYNAVTNYTIVTAAGGVNAAAPANATLSVSPTSSFSDLMPSLSVVGNNLNLRLEYAPTAYEGAVRSFVPQFVDVEPGALSTILSSFSDAEKNQIIPTSMTAATALFSSQPENLTNVSLNAGNRATQLVFNSSGPSSSRNSGRRVGNAGGRWKNRRSGNSSRRRSADRARNQTAGLASGLGLSPTVSGMIAPPLAPDEEDGEDNSAWLQGYYLDGVIDGIQGTRAIDHDTTGFVLGSDWEVNPKLVVGAMVGYAQTDTNQRGFTNDSRVDNLQFGVYADWSFEKGWYAKGLAMYADADYESRRQFAFGTINRTATADYDGDEFTLSAELGKTMQDEDHENFFFKPHLQVTYKNLDQDAFSETGRVTSTSVWVPRTETCSSPLSEVRSTGSTKLPREMW